MKKQILLAAGLSSSWSDAWGFLGLRSVLASSSSSDTSCFDLEAKSSASSSSFSDNPFFDEFAGLTWDVNYFITGSASENGTELWRTSVMSFLTIFWWFIAKPGPVVYRNAQWIGCGLVPTIATIPVLRSFEGQLRDGLCDLEVYNA